MRKYFFLSIFIVVSATSVNGQIRIGLKGGLNSSTARVVTPGGEKPDVENGIGFHAGVSLKLNIEGQIYFVPQLQYAYKTFSINYNNDDTSTNTLRYHYIEIPILFEWKKSTYASGIFFQFGPSMSVALGGKEEIEGKSGSSTSRPINFGFNAYGRMEANLIVNIGYQFGKNLQVTAGYAHGLGTIIDDDFGPQIKPRMITASVLYWFH